MPGERRSDGRPDIDARRHIDELLDKALTETFPASDPVSMLIPRSRDGQVVVTERQKRTADKIGKGGFKWR